MGERLTEADWRLATTLFRFDPVYHGHFKLNRRRIVDYPNLWAYARELYQVPGVAGTVDFAHITSHYYRSHETINPTRIVPVGPRSTGWSRTAGSGGQPPDRRSGPGAQLAQAGMSLNTRDCSRVNFRQPSLTGQ